MLRNIFYLNFLVLFVLISGCNKDVVPSMVFTDANTVIDSNAGDDSACVPVCAARECGDDGCGGSCWKADKAECDDGLACTDDTCGTDGKCAHIVKKSFCLVNGKCLDDGAKPDRNQCLVCRPGLAADKLSPVEDGTGCGSEMVCYQGECCRPSCAGKECGNDGCGGDCAGPNGCNDKLGCTMDACDTSFTCAHEIKPDTCLIDDKCYAKGATNPDKECEVCDPAQNPKKWSIANDGTACNGGKCVNGECCQPKCQGKECGPDSCGGSCGGCGPFGTCYSGHCFNEGDNCGSLVGPTCVDNAVIYCSVGNDLYVMNCSAIGMNCECKSSVSKCSLVDTGGVSYACTKDGCSNNGDTCLNRRVRLVCGTHYGKKVEKAVDCMQGGQVCVNGKCVKPDNQPCKTLVPPEGLCAGSYAFFCNSKKIIVNNCTLSGTYCDYDPGAGVYQCAGR